MTDTSAKLLNDTSSFLNSTPSSSKDKYIYKCLEPNCDLATNDRSRYETHRYSHKPNFKPFPCPYLIHDGEKYVKCPAKPFKLQGQLKKHIGIHDREKKQKKKFPPKWNENYYLISYGKS